MWGGGAPLPIEVFIFGEIDLKTPIHAPKIVVLGRFDPLNYGVELS